MPTNDPLASPRLPALISAERFATYLNACSHKQDEAMRLYIWNIEVSAALWGDFSLLEVFLRNALHNQLMTLTGQPDWWNSTIPTLHRDHADVVARAENYARATKGSQYEAGDVVAQLTLGFWTSLLANRYHQRLWVPALIHAFPNWTTRRGPLQQKLERLRRLRNRVAHHEPIFMRNLNLDHVDVLSVLGSIDVDAKDLAISVSRLPGVVAAKADTLSGSRMPTF